jgi:hypothetical protein
MIKGRAKGLWGQVLRPDSAKEEARPQEGCGDCFFYGKSYTLETCFYSHIQVTKCSDPTLPHESP